MSISREVTFYFEPLWFPSVLILLFTLGLVLKRQHNLRVRRFPPGPTGVPLFGYLPFLGKEPHKTLAKLSKKYGKIFSLYFGPSFTVIISDYELAKEVLCRPNMMARHDDLFSFIPGNGGFSGSNDEVWKEQRRFCLKSMKELGVGRGPWEEILQEDSAAFVKELSSCGGMPFDVKRSLLLYGANNNVALLTGRRLPKNYNDPDMKIIMDALHVLVEHFAVSSGNSVAPWLSKYLVKFHIAGYHKSEKILKDFSNLIRKEIEKHMCSEDVSHTKDFIGLYLDEMKRQEASGQKHYFSVYNLVGHIAVLFFTGSDTTMTSLYWLFLLMANHQEVQRKVQEELTDVIGKDGTVTWSDRTRLPYTMATIMEAERWVAINPLYPSRWARGDTEVNGFVIPNGSAVITNSWAIMHDEKHWEKPDEFLPKRFLHLTNQSSSKIEGYCPFSFGKRSCPGENIAMMTIMLFFTAVMQRYTVSTPSGDPADLTSNYGITIIAPNQELCFK